jgi:transcriptional regulator with XRE-family HTH domain
MVELLDMIITNNTYNIHIIALRIRQLCKVNNTTVSTLAVNAKIAASTVYNIINENCENPRISTINSICIALHISISAFFDYDHLNHKDS